jgi:ABC-type transport system substrate-binding protein
MPNSYFSKKEIPRHSNGYVGNNIFGWHQAFIDDLFKKQLKDFEIDNVRQYANQLHERLAAELPYIPLYWHLDTAFAGRRIGGFQLSGHYLPSSAYAYGWASLAD